MLQHGQVDVRLGFLGTFVQTRHDDHDDVVGRGEIDIVHDQSLFVSEARVAVDVGVRGFAISLVLPLRLVSTGITYYDEAGAEVELVDDGVHHRDETLSGLGDPMLLVGRAKAWGPWRVGAKLGATVPLGRTEEDPFVMPDDPHQHIQMGTGTVNPVVSVELARALGPRWRMSGFLFTQQVVYEGGKGYQAGDRYAAGVAARWRAAERIGLRGGVEVQGETKERWGGVAHTDDGNRGRVDAMVVAGVEWAVSGPLSVDLAVKVPVVTHVVGGQLDMPAIVEVGVGWTFGGAKKEGAHEHGDEHDHGDEHEHGDEHDHEETDTSELDIADLGQPGEAVELVPVEGKITVFDFWATWCAPCEDVEHALIDLAREHPGKIAIRRIDVVDWDSAAVARWLTPGGFALPHVKVYADGELLLERSGEPHDASALIEELHRVIDAAAD